MRILLTGAAGFVGSHVLEHLLETTDHDVVCLVRLSTAGDLLRLIDSKHYQEHANRVTVVHHDLKSPIPSYVSERFGTIHAVLHLAANSHVDRSITHPVEFFQDNVMGTVHLLEWARHYHAEGQLSLFGNFNSDEVFGPAPDLYDYKEDDRWRPSNPYSASKAGQAAAGIGYYVTYRLPVINTFTMNIFGQRQNPEKLVAKTIRCLQKDLEIPIHCELPAGIPETTDESLVLGVGQRHWLHARNAADALCFLLKHGQPGEAYNVVGDIELTNLQMVRMIADIAGKTPRLRFMDWHSRRPGHDRRYSLNGSKIAAMGWKPPTEFTESLERTVKWTLEHPEWL